MTENSAGLVRPRNERALTILIVSACLVMTVMKYSGLSDSYLLLLTYFNNPEFFPNDIYFSNSYYPQVSIFLAFNKILRFEESEIRTIAAYLGVVAFTAYFAYRIFRVHFHIGDRAHALFAVLLMFFIDRHFPNSVWSGIVPLTPGTPTMIAHGLSIAFLYFLLERRLAVAAVLVLAILALNVKTYFLLGPIFALYVLFNGKINKWNLLWLAIPCAYILFKSLTAIPVPATFSDRLEMWNAVAAFEAQDSDFWRQPRMALLLLVASFGAFAVMTRRLDNPHLRALAFGGIAASVLVFVFGMVYMGGLYEFLPYPAIMALGLVRSLEFYFFLFYATAFVIIIRADWLLPLERAASITALVMLHGHSWSGIAFPIIILSLGFFVARFGGVAAARLGAVGVIPLTVVLLAILVVFQVARGGVFNPLFDRNSYVHLNRFVPAMAADTETWDAYASLRGRIEGDLLLAYFVDAGTTLRWHATPNLLARKTPFISGGYNLYFLPALYREHLRREAIADAIAAALNGKRPLPEDILTDMRRYRLTVVAPAEAAARLPGPSGQVYAGAFVALTYFE